MYHWADIEQTTVTNGSAFIPCNPDNGDYQSVLHWVAAGNQIAACPLPSLTQVKTDAKHQIDLEAEAARLKYITAGAGQALEYNEAAEEAVRYAATGGAGAYPMLQASVDAGEAPDLATAAALVTGRENAWATIGATIRRLRLTAKRGVDAATTVDQVQAAATVTWP